MLALVSLAAVAVLIGLTVRAGFRDLHESVEDARRDRLVRAAERELKRLTGERFP